MKTLLALILLFQSLHAFKTEKKVQIGKHTFTLIEESYNEYGDKGITMALYDTKSNKEASAKLSFLIKNESGTCSDKDIEDGMYSIDKDTVILYSHWERSKDSDDAPIGDRIQVYKVEDNGSFVMKDSHVYIEKSVQNEDADEGMQYLYKEAKTEEEKLHLKEYIASVEKIYKAKFVRGTAARKLADEVRKAIRTKKSARWK